MRKKNWIEFNNNNIKTKDLDDKVFESQSKKLKIHKEKKGKKEKLLRLLQDFDHKIFRKLLNY